MVAFDALCRASGILRSTSCRCQPAIARTVQLRHSHLRCASSKSSRSYEAAITALNTLQSNSSVVAQIRTHGRQDNKNAIPEMLQWVSRIGYQPSDFDKLNIIHVAGTKGKGSTCAFISSILARYSGNASGPACTPVGLFTSPHLRFVRERIQIDNQPISETLFAKYFFEIWDRLSKTGDGTKPMYFRFLTIMAFHTFLQERVKSAVIECGIGGEYDSTNIINKPTVSAISALGVDHEALLGSTLPEIAWHKAGIYKAGATALTVEQPVPAMQVLERRANEASTPINVVRIHPKILSGEAKLGLAAEYQKSNAALAVAASSAHLRALGHDVPDLVKNIDADLPSEFVEGLREVSWPGRSQIKHEPQHQTSWYIDGAHTMESIEVAAKWFAKEILQEPEKRQLVLIFNQQSRDAVTLLKALRQTISANSGAVFDKVVFTTNVTYSSTGYKSDLISINNDADQVSSLGVQKKLAETWRDLEPSTSISVTSSIEHAVGIARADAVPKRVLVIGSLHLVGGVLEVLESIELKTGQSG